MAQAGSELRSRDRSSPSNDAEEDANTLHGSFEPQAPGAAVSLPPADTGKQAWLFLAACWGVEALTFGESSIIPAVCFAWHLGGSCC